MSFDIHVTLKAKSKAAILVEDEDGEVKPTTETNKETDQ